MHLIEDVFHRQILLLWKADNAVISKKEIANADELGAVDDRHFQIVGPRFTNIEGSGIFCVVQLKTRG